jgi:Flp pilus assembly protein TadD
VGAAVLDRRYGLARGFEHYDDQMGLRRTAAGGEAERTADRVVDAALAWLAGAPERFFLWVHLYDPHADYEPPPGFAAAFPRQLYAGEIAFADFETGRLLAALKDRYGDAGTLVVATSDHGESRGEHDELTHSLTLYDATQRVPLVMSGPGLPRGAVVTAPVRLADVAPTLLALAGLPPLAEASGGDLRPWIAGAREATPPAYLETLAPHLDFRWSPLYGLRSARWKYVRAPRPELYDLAADPGETENRFEASPELARDLDAQLERHLASARPLRAELALDAEERARLASLGYLPHAPDEALALGRVEGPDPKDEIRSVLALQGAWGAVSRGEAEQGLAVLESWRRAGSFSQPSPFVAWTFAEVALAAGDAEAAERHAREALAARPGFAEALLVLGAALEAQGRLAEAREAFERAAEAAPEHARPLLGLGRIAEAEGRPAEARGWYERARDARVPDAEARERLDALDAAGR